MTGRRAGAPLLWTKKKAREGVRRRRVREANREEASEEGVMMENPRLAHRPAEDRPKPKRRADSRAALV